MATNQSASSNATWTSAQAYIFAVLTLAVGFAAGWFVRGSHSQPAPQQAAVSAEAPAGMGQQMPSPEQMKHMADTQAASKLAELKSNPNDPKLLAEIGNIYYDTHVFNVAIDYYQRSLKLQPANTDVRTDLATAYWLSGDADTALAEFNKSLSYDPNKPNTLLNMGIVKFEGKMDVNGAVAAWEKLLKANPNYPNKDRVMELIAQAKKHSNVKPGQQANPLP